MDVITLDFETYYDKDFSLKKLTTEEYIRDPRFEVIGVGIKINHEATEWAWGTHEQLALACMPILCASPALYMGWKLVQVSKPSVRNTKLVSKARK